MIVKDRSQHFKKIEGKKISHATKKSFNIGVVFPAKMIFCNECNDKIISRMCNKQINKDKVFEVN